MKIIDTKIYCDSCNEDISPRVTGMPRIDILKVTCENVAIHEMYGAICAIHQMPILTHDLYFCGLGCMTNYKEKINV